MIFNWLTQRRRQKILAAPFPEHWDEIIDEAVWQAHWLAPEQRQKLRRLVQVLVAEKNWEGCDGLVVAEEMKVAIAAQAALLVTGLPEEEYFEHVLSVLIYPAGYVARDARPVGGGMVIEGEQDRIGEAWYRGPVVVSWEDVLGIIHQEQAGRNVVLHEFAHQLDMLNGRDVDGVPRIVSPVLAQRWTAVMDAEYDRLVRACRKGREGLIDCYGATSPAEFFAVVTETFFETGKELEQERPEAYGVLREFYGVDPARWEEAEFEDEPQA